MTTNQSIRLDQLIGAVHASENSLRTLSHLLASLTPPDEPPPIVIDRLVSAQAAIRRLSTSLDAAYLPM